MIDLNGICSSSTPDWNRKCKQVRNIDVVLNSLHILYFVLINYLINFTHLSNFHILEFVPLSIFCSKTVKLITNLGGKPVECRCQDLSYLDLRRHFDKPSHTSYNQPIFTPINIEGKSLYCDCKNIASRRNFDEIDVFGFPGFHV